MLLNTSQVSPFFFFWESLRFLFNSCCSASMFIWHVTKAWHLFLETIIANSIHSERTSVSLTAQKVKCTGLLSDTWAVSEQWIIKAEDDFHTLHTNVPLRYDVIRCYVNSWSHSRRLWHLCSIRISYISLYFDQARNQQSAPTLRKWEWVVGVIIFLPDD